MKVGNKLYTDKKEAGTALVEMCKEIKSVNAPAVIGEYAGFKMAVSFDSFNHKFVMNIKGQLSHNLEIGVDPLVTLPPYQPCVGSHDKGTGRSIHKAGECGASA